MIARWITGVTAVGRSRPSACSPADRARQSATVAKIRQPNVAVVISNVPGRVIIAMTKQQMVATQLSTRRRRDATSSAVCPLMPSLLTDDLILWIPRLRDDRPCATSPSDYRAWGVT
jgi:hypothetical protein